jgi:nucleoside-diphosphate-sugar epimerase
MKSKETGPINLGSPFEMQIIQLARRIIKLTNSKSKIVYKSLPEDDPKVRRPNINMAKKRLKWQPKIKVENGLKKTIKWFKEK